MAALDSIREASYDLNTDEELRAAFDMIRKRAAQINRMADYRSIAENGFEPGDPVVSGGKVFKVVRVRLRSLVVTDGSMAVLLPSKGKVTGTSTPPKLRTWTYQARHFRLADELFKVSRQAHQKSEKGDI